MKMNTHNFLRDLQKLLEKYKAEIVADDHHDGYPESGRNIRMTVEFDNPSVVFGNAPEIDLGGWINEHSADGLASTGYPPKQRGK